MRQRSQPVKQSEKKVAAKLAPASPAASAKKKLSYKEQQELKELPGRIEALEKDIAALQAKMSDPAFFKSEPALVAATTNTLAEKEQALEMVFNRWSELEP